MNRKKALITGVTGQIGSYLAEHLLTKGYEVHGISSKEKGTALTQYTLHVGSINDETFMQRKIEEIKPDEIYNLAAQSNSCISWEIPVKTHQVNAQAVIHMLEGVRKELPLTKFFQAGSAELFGGNSQETYTEKTPFNPRNPYAVAKAAAFYEVRNWREREGLFFVNGIIFNAESPRRGEGFVTTKIARAAAQREQRSLEVLSLGNLSAERDWTHAQDTAEAIYQMMQHRAPEDCIIASGRKNTVRDFATLAYNEVGIPLRWSGEGKEEKGYDSITGNLVVDVSPDFFRPVELECLRGDASKLTEKTGWKPKHSLPEIVIEMVAAEKAKLR